MKLDFRITALLALLFLAACGPVTKYTMLQPGGTIKQRGDVAEWPDLSKWEKTEMKSEDAAVIIAIEDYAFLPDVVGAVQNANDWENYFRDAKGMEDVFVLTNQNAPIEEINRFTKQAVDATKSGGTIWFVFIGHGAANKSGTDGLLVGMDAQQTVGSISTRSLAKNDLVSMLTKDGRKAVVVLDTCFSGKSSTGELLATGTQPVIPIIKPTENKGGVTILSAAQADEVAGELTNGARPAFSYLLLGALRGWADDGDGNVTTAEAIQFTKTQLRLVKGRQQTPNLDGEGSVVLSTGASEKDPGVTDLIQGKGVIVEVPNPNQRAMINTNLGIVVPVLKNWSVPDSSPYGGMIYSSRAMLQKSSISIRRDILTQLQSASDLQDEPYLYEGESISEPPNASDFGPYSGMRMTVTKVAGATLNSSSSISTVFKTYQNGAVWTFTLESDQLEHPDQSLVDFKTFISEATFQ